MKYLSNLILLIRKIIDRILMEIFKHSFKSRGNNIRFFPLNSTFNFKNISIGNDVFIGEKAFFFSSVSHIFIGSKVMFGPNVTIRGGNHASHIIGKYLFDYNEKDKLITDDQDVIIKDDVWVGTNVTILKGVILERGCIVAAGSLVNKSFPPYSIVAGIPAKVVKFRFSIEEILQHELELYPESKRLSREYLEENIKMYATK